MRSKLNLRRQLLVMRQGVQTQELRFATREAKKRILQLVDWSAVQRVHIYDARRDWREIGTKSLRTELQKRYPHLSIETSDSRLEPPMPAGKYDVIILPVLGFDSAGYRIGMGRGWYDRFLAEQPQAYKIGVAYRWAARERVPHEAHDIPLDTIIAV